MTTLEVGNELKTHHFETQEDALFFFTHAHPWQPRVLAKGNQIEAEAGVVFRLRQLKEACGLTLIPDAEMKRKGVIYFH